MIRINSKYILPGTSDVIQNGSILAKNGKIQFVGAEKECPNNTYYHVFDYPNHLIIPGLVNSHTHLSLSKLKNVFKRGMDFPDWINKIIFYSNNLQEKDEKEAIQDGIREMIDTGTTAAGDISRNGFSLEVMKNMGLRGKVFYEVTGFKRSMEEQHLNRIHKFQAKWKKNNVVEYGISPHSPYSVSPQLIKTTFSIAKKNKLSLAIHIAETKEECKFIAEGKGPFRKLLQDLGKWEKEWEPKKMTPIKYLSDLGVLKGITGIHLNYINNDDLEIIQKNNLSVVYCPKSNQWFHRKDPYPLMKLLEKGINVAIGTDSLASNENLNMFEEMILIKKQFPQIKNKTLLQMATINGAKALGLANKTGSLEAGKEADLIGLKMNNPGDIYKTIFESKGNIVFSMVGGNFILP